MQKRQISQTDLIVVLTATLCIITVNLPFFPTLDLTIKNFFSILILFIMGYAFLTLIRPVSSLSVIKKVFYSLLGGLILLITVSTLMDALFTTIMITEPNLVIILSIITLIAVIFAYMRRKINLRRVNGNNIIQCQKCGGYYQLQEGESLENFGTCQCGGKLEQFVDTPKSVDTEEHLKETEDSKTSGYLPRDLIIISLIAVVSLVISFIPSLNTSILVIILIIPFLLLLPGYSLTAVFFPRKDDLEEIERIALSFGLSIILAPLIGLILNYTPFGINLVPILVSLSIISIVMCSIAYLKRWRVPEENRFIFRFKDYLNR